ncbi:Pyridine nucleotide-disulphide oxidoreductase [Kibdelosporangium aridum]|uniref:Pyridine nucleotide-disulphide oxidoreductase n=1 Tax=Kibdelosporangium aridum TaxID=2030 RepID=A0A1W2FZI9_KIBAR|nr:Pyridine nucleotide-disulphide oxidoreductase [Kibdelosporangium aridum]
MSVPGEVLVVGASAAGLATAEALRRKGYRGRLTLLGAEPHLPYDRPPLSKQVFGLRPRAFPGQERIPALRLVTDIDKIPFKHDASVYGVYELPVTW